MFSLGKIGQRGGASVYKDMSCLIYERLVSTLIIHVLIL